jgi:16S rRNA processing protein RimM
VGTSETPTAPPEGHVVVARVLAAWGIRGELKVEPLSDVPGRLGPGSDVHLNGKPVRIVLAHRKGRDLVLKLDAVSDRNHAETLRGALLTVPQADVPPPPGGAYYHFQVVGMDVFDERHRKLGTVIAIIATGANDVYVIGGKDGSELLLPATADCILKVSLETNRMTVRLPEYE